MQQMYVLVCDILNICSPLQEVLRRASWCQAIWLTSLYRSCHWSTVTWSYVPMTRMQLVAFSRTRERWTKWPKPCCMFLKKRNSSLHRAANPSPKESTSFYRNGIKETHNNTLEWSRNDCWCLKCTLYNIDNASETKKWSFNSVSYTLDRNRGACL